MRTSRRAARILPIVLVLGIAVPMSSPSAAEENDDPVIVAVGDLVCPSGRIGLKSPRVCRSDAVAELVTEIAPDRFLPLGDLQYEDGSLQRFQTAYDAQFGHLKDITWPVPGNHEYRQEGASGYFGYFGEIAHPPHGYYANRLGDWLVIALNSELCDEGACEEDGAQYLWLEEVLEEHSHVKCTLAYMHHPRYDWRPYQKWIRDEAGQTLYGGSETEPYVPLWELLYEHEADVVLAAHNHLYQRWAPQDAHWNETPDGIVQFTVGTGGRLLYALGRPPMPDALEVTQNKAHGVLKMTLHEDAYSYEWMSAPGQPAFTDVGSRSCT
jgi:acid phosphatase type 7